ncbi:DNA-binding XRE family transcriptional regulator [Cohnella lupini]|uniref:DNA-binding XRE family transcriptional regulator n=2 Tax=Cohnella lupini TaxID=1294267 RepID=A0A3D9I2M3_9BACL|nr:DNA-binding XRE family transcriptional regulator [Cohnella lupini]
MGLPNAEKVMAEMEFGEKLKSERTKRGWSQEELAEKLFVSRQSVSKWENSQNYPSIEIIIKISDLFGVTIDELLRSDEGLTKKVIQDGKQLAYPRLKFALDVLFLLGVALLVIKLGILLLNKAFSFDLTLVGGAWIWNFGPLVLMVGAGICSGVVKEKYKED